MTWGLPATAIGAAASLINLTTGNILTAVHNIFADAASQWDYATIDIGGPNGGLPIIGNYGGWLNVLGGPGGAFTTGPFVFLEGGGSTTPGVGGAPPTHTSGRDYYANEALRSDIYGNQQPLHTATHEKGHTDQNLVYGPLYLPFAIIFSLLPNAWNANVNTSGWFWFDRQANRWSGPNNPFNPNAVINP